MCCLFPVQSGVDPCPEHSRTVKSVADDLSPFPLDFFLQTQCEPVFLILGPNIFTYTEFIQSLFVTNCDVTVTVVGPLYLLSKVLTQITIHINLLFPTSHDSVVGF